VKGKWCQKKVIDLRFTFDFHFGEIAYCAPWISLLFGLHAVSDVFLGVKISRKIQKRRAILK